MHHHRVLRFIRALVVVTFVLVVSPQTVQAAPQTFSITIDTSSIAGAGGPPIGGIGLQFNPTIPPPPPGAESASASFSNFSHDGVSGGPTMPFFGDVTGDLASGTLVINNTVAFNIAIQPLVFGNTLSFDVTFSGDALDPPSLSTESTIFGVALLDSFGMPLLAGDPMTGSAFTLRINPDGSITTVTQNPAVSVARPMPEPTSMVIMGISLAAVGYGYCRRRKRQLTAHG